MKTEVVAPPLEAELLLTTRCNMRCPHCCANAKNNTDENIDLPTHVWIDTIEQLINMGVQTFTLTGGEPTLHKGLMEFIRIINTSKAHCAITTNAFFIDEAFITQLLSLNLDTTRISFHISIDGPEEKHDEFRKTPGAFKKAIRAMKSLNSVGIEAKTNFMLTSESLLWFDELEAIVSEAGCTSINIGQCAPVGRNNISVGYEKWCDFIRNTTQKQKEGKYKCYTRCMSHGIWQVYLPLLDHQRDAYTIWGKKPEVTADCNTCPAGVFTIAIDGNGWVYPCDLMTSYPELRCGNILDNTISDIWNNSTVFHDLRKVDFKKIQPCSTCFLAEECHSGCRGSTYGLTGSLEAPDIRCPMVSNYVRGKYPRYKHNKITGIVGDSRTLDSDKAKTIKIFNSEIRLIEYEHSYVAKSKWTGNSFMIINPFGFRILQMIESGVDYKRLIEQLSCGNERIKAKLEKDILSFLMELIVKKIIPYRETKDYFSFNASKPINALKEPDDLPQLIYYKVKSNYLVYLTQIPKIVLMNETGFIISQLYLKGKSIENIVQQLSERYPYLTEDELLNDTKVFLNQVQLRRVERG